MSDITVTDNSEALLNSVENEIESFLRRVLLKIKNTAEDLLSQPGTAGKKFPTNTTHELRKNLREDVYREAGKIIGVLGVGANVPYSIFVHEGTKAHFPPVLAIQQWILDKGFLKSGSKKISRGFLRSQYRNKNKTRGTDAANQVKAIAFLIARKISRQGTQAIPFLRLALNQNVEWVAGQMNNLKLT